MRPAERRIRIVVYTALIALDTWWSLTDPTWFRWVWAAVATLFAIYVYQLMKEEIK